MSRYFIYLSYDGANYHGWQCQPNGVSVEETIEKSLSLLFGKEMDIVGAGRTDAGVNAVSMVAHFDMDGEFPVFALQRKGQTPEQQLRFKLNRMLPPDIAIQKIVKVRNDAHARFDAIERTYHYFVTTEKNPFRTNHYFRVSYDVDFEKMNEAAKFLIKKGDFASFAKTHSDVKTTICDVRRAEWVNVGENAWRFEISADRFLRNMVRSVVGTLLDVGRGRLSPKDIVEVMENKDRRSAGESVFGGALFLCEVKYPQEIFYVDDDPVSLI